MRRGERSRPKKKNTLDTDLIQEVSQCQEHKRHTSQEARVLTDVAPDLYGSVHVRSERVASSAHQLFVQSTIAFRSAGFGNVCPVTQAQNCIHVEEVRYTRQPHLQQR